MSAWVEGAQRRGDIWRFEQTGKQLMLYLTELPPRGTSSVQYRLQATMPVRAADGGAVAALYYQRQQQSHAASQLLTATGD